MSLTLNTAEIELDDNGTPLALDLNNAASQSPGLVKWASGAIRAELRYRELILSGPYTTGNYSHAIKTQLHCHTTQSDGAKTPHTFNLRNR